MSKKKLLIIESMSHYKVLENAYQLLNEDFDLTFYISSFSGYEEIVEFPSHKLCKTVIKPLPPFLSFWPLLLIARKYDHICISTGPEGDHWTCYFELLFFSIFCLFYRSNITLTIRTPRAYLPRSGKWEIKSIIRNRVARLIKRFTFEIPSCLENFKRDSGHKSALCGLSFDRYTDTTATKFNELPLIDPMKPVVRIGLLGIIDYYRKDYRTVIDALKMLNEEELSRIEFVNVAYCPNGSDNSIIREISEYCRVDIYEGFLDTEVFDERGSSCHLLMSPFERSLEYGTYKASGSFGDMVYLKRKALIPRFSDPILFYKEIAFHYDDKESLAAYFKNVLSLASEEIDEEFIDSFKAANVLKNLFKDLKITI